MENNEYDHSIKWCYKCKNGNYHNKFHIICNLTRKNRQKKANKIKK